MKYIKAEYTVDCLMELSGRLLMAQDEAHLDIPEYRQRIEDALRYLIEEEHSIYFGFDKALTLLNDGLKVQRSGWNGKDMFLFLVSGSTFKVNRYPLMGIYPEGTQINYRPHIDMKTDQGDIVPWVASQTDLLATDWVLVK